MRFTRGHVWELKNAHNSITVQNQTHVYMNFFDHKNLGNHLLQLCPKVVKYPVWSQKGAMRTDTHTVCYKGNNSSLNSRVVIAYRIYAWTSHIVVLWLMTSCSLVGGYQSFREMHCIHEDTKSSRIIGLLSLVTFPGLLDHEDTAIRKDICNYLSNDMAWHARRHNSTAIPLWEPQISNSASIFVVKRWTNLGKEQIFRRSGGKWS